MTSCLSLQKLAPVKIVIINGPNLNLLGKRETQIYGDKPFESFLDELRSDFPSLGIDYFQSNIEGEIVDKLQEAGRLGIPAILNAAGYSHTSVAIADAVRAIPVDVIEVHISNIYMREPFRHQSLIASVACGIIVGFGLEGYRLAINYLLRFQK